MHETPVQRALTAATLSLLAALAAIAMFLPPLAQRTLSSVLNTVLAASALALALLLHWVYVGIAAHRMRRPLGLWVGMAVLLFPIGSAAGLILLAWFDDEGNAVVPRAR